MKLSIVAISGKPPIWLETGILEYSKRLPKHLKLEVMLRSPSRKATLTQRQQEEAEFLLKHLGKRSLGIACDEKGIGLTSQELGKQLEAWSQGGQDMCFFLGGPDGLHQSCRDAADIVWSLSPLTFPHHIARLLVVEQLYRAWTLVQGHPYHRE